MATNRRDMTEDENEPNTRCENCGYEWKYSGSMSITTCPDCQRKTVTRTIEEPEA